MIIRAEQFPYHLHFNIINIFENVNFDDYLNVIH